MNFKLFLETEEKDNIENTLKKLPKNHSNLIKGFSFHFQQGNTLKGDKENIGELDPNSKKITVAAPWHYGREFTFLHEIGHRVYDEILTPKQKASWKALVKKIKSSPDKKCQNQSIEELFCMAYANTYAKHKDKIHDHPEWEKFILSL